VGGLITSSFYFRVARDPGTIPCAIDVSMPSAPKGSTISMLPEFDARGEAHFLYSASQFITRVSGEGVSVTQFNIRKRPSRVTS